MRTKILGIALPALVLVGSAHANVIFFNGQNINENPAENIRTETTGVVPLGTPLIGSVSARPGLIIQFTSQTNDMMATSGAAGLTAVPPPLRNVTLSIPG